MPRNSIITMLACGGLLLSSAVFSQSSTVGTDSVAPGDTATIALTWDDPTNSITQMQFDVVFDTSVVDGGSIDFSNCQGNTLNGTTVNCTFGPGGTTDRWRVAIITFPPQVIGSGALGTVDLPTFAAAPLGVSPLTIVNAVYSDAVGQVPSAGDTSGSITLLAPAGEGFYASNPAPGATLAFGSAEVGSSAGTQAVNVQNLSPDTAFDVTGVNVAAPISNSDAFDITVSAGGNADVTFECTPDARGLLSGGVAILHDAVNGAGSPVDYDYTCTGLAPLVSVTPPSQTANVLAIPGGTSDFATYSVFNDNADGFSSTATGFALVTPLVSGPGGTAPTIGVTGIPDIAPGVTTTFNVTCDADENTTEGTWVYDVNVTWTNPDPSGDDSATVQFTCEVVAAVPEYDSTPAPGDTIPFGSVTNGLTSAPQGIDVQNDGVGPSPDSDLNITGVSTTDNSGGSVFAAIINNAGPFLVGAAGTVDAITVTCTPDTVGPITGTLTVNTNDPTEPAGGFEYDLECEGLSDGEFSSDPDNGGTLNLGTVFPGDTTAPGSITFENDGTFDDIEVFGCSVSDPDGVMSFTPNPIPDPITVGPGGAESITFQCTPPLPGGYQATLSCSGVDGDQNFTGPLSYTILCQGQPLVVPTMNWWGLIALAALLLMLGGFASRRSGRNRA